MNADEPTPVTQRTVTVDFVAALDIGTEPIPLSELPRAIKENRREIVVGFPWWLPYYAVGLPLIFLIGTMVSGQLSVYQGRISSYNVEHCSKIAFKGVEYSNCVKLTKP